MYIAPPLPSRRNWLLILLTFALAGEVALAQQSGDPAEAATVPTILKAAEQGHKPTHRQPPVPSEAVSDPKDTAADTARGDVPPARESAVPVPAESTDAAETVTPVPAAIPESASGAAPKPDPDPEPAPDTPDALGNESDPSISHGPRELPPAQPQEAVRADSEEHTEGGVLRLLGNEVPRGTSTRLAWSPSESFSGIAVPTPVLVINGVEPGPTLCLTAAIHGDELTGIEIVRRVMFAINPQKLTGAVIGVPIVNLQGFRRNSRYLPDRRDLNRYFPGNSGGSLAARVAHSFFNEVVTRCDALVDMHTGSFHRTNLPQVRADMNDSGVAQLARNLGAIVVLQSRGNSGTLRRAAVEHGIPAVTLEAGEPMRLAEDQVAHGVQSIHSVLNGMEMYGRPSIWGKPEPVYYKSFWVRSNTGGILFSRVKLGDRVQTGDVLGTVTDPITNARAELTSPHGGRVIGMALNQVVMPGFAAYHIGIQTTEEHAAEPVAGLEEPEESEGENDAPEMATERGVQAPASGEQLPVDADRLEEDS